MELNDIPTPRLARYIKLLGDEQVRELFASGGLPLLYLTANRALRASKSLWRRENQSSRMENEVLYTGPIIIGPRLAEAMVGAPIVIRESDRRSIVRWHGTANVAVDGKIVASPVVIADLRRIDEREEHMAEVIWTGDQARIHIWQPAEWRSTRTADLLEITDETAPDRRRRRTSVADYGLAPCVPIPVIDYSQYCDPTYDLLTSDEDLPTHPEMRY